MTTALVLLAVLWLAYSNGANDNFKGVATIYGSNTLGFRPALVLATISTAAGCLFSTLLAGKLARAFSGQGLLPDAALVDPAFLVTVGAAAALTILLATVLGMPTSTTHALTGALMGVAIVMPGAHASLARLWDNFLLPLLVSPLLALSLAYLAERAFVRVSRSAFDASAEEACVCAGPAAQPQAVVAAGSAVATEARAAMTIAVASESECAARFTPQAFRARVRPVIDALHVLSAGAVCFARAVNDTPKVAALLFSVGALGAHVKLGWVAVAMVIGGLLQSRKVAETMSKHITTMSHAQGLTGNLVTAALVLGASRLGVPVSTTHVSCGAVFGIGAARGTTNIATVRQIIATWLTTLPLAGALGAGGFSAWSAWSG